MSRFLLAAIVISLCILASSCEEQNQATDESTTTFAISHLPATKDSLLELVKLTGEDTNRVNVLYKLTNVLPLYSDTTKIVIQQALQLSVKLHYAPGIVNSANTLGNYYYFRANNDSAAYYYKLALGLLDSTWDSVSIGRTFGNMSNYYKALGQFDSSIYYAKRGYEVFTKIGDNVRVGIVLNNLGFSYVQIGEFDSAIDCHLRSLKIKQTMNDSHGISTSYTNIATIYFDQHEFDKMKSYILKALEIDVALNDTNALAGTYNNLGEYYRNTGKYDSATYYLQKALTFSKQTGNNTWLVVSLHNLGMCSKQKGNYAEAIDYFNQSLDMYEQAGDQDGIAHAYINLGRTYLLMKNFPLAKSSLETALALSLKSGVRVRIKDSYEELADLYYESGNYREAFDYQIKYEKIKDTLFEEGKEKYIEELLVKYDSEKNEKELIRQNAEIEQKNAEALQRGTERNMFIGGFAIVLLFSVFLYNRFTVTRKQRNIINQQKEIVESQKNVVEEKNKSITDSINYSRRIQYAMMPSPVYLKKHLHDYFLYYKPKDIVSGDFIWMFSPKDKQVLLATADCTGHGVPGALMSMVGISMLKEIVIEKKNQDPGTILNVLRDGIITAVNPEGSETESNDGMDISLCRIDFEKMQMEYAAANNSIYIVRNSLIIELEPDHFPVGKYTGDLRAFTTHKVSLENGDVVYAFTDGFADQFGGPKGKKFKYAQFKKLLIDIHSLPMTEQRIRIEKSFEEWRGDIEQVDDVCIIGIRIQPD
jgi:serine phosphatase RsbU (regulator of sigma subunit)/Tfp pilus assembly protein PilF